MNLINKVFLFPFKASFEIFAKSLLFLTASPCSSTIISPTLSKIERGLFEEISVTIAPLKF